MPRFMSPREVAALPELAVFSALLAAYVENGRGQQELVDSIRTLVAMAHQRQLTASIVVSAIELIGCPPLKVAGEARRSRIDRYTGVMAAMLRGFMAED